MRLRVRPSTRKLRKKLISSKKRRTSSLNSSQDLVRQRLHKMKLRAIKKMRLKLMTNKLKLTENTSSSEN